MRDVHWWSLLLALGVIAAIVGLYFGIRSQMRRRQTLAGPVPPDNVSGGEPPAVKGEESVMERHAEEWEAEAKGLGHG